MNFSEYLYIVAVFVFIAFLYMFCHARRMDLERRISLGRIQVNRILAVNGRRLSDFGLQIERQFSESGNYLDPRDGATELRRRSTLESIPESEKKQRDRHTKQETERKTWKQQSDIVSTIDLPNVAAVCNKPEQIRLDHTGHASDIEKNEIDEINETKTVGSDTSLNDAKVSATKDDRRSNNVTRGEQHVRVSEDLREPPVLAKSNTVPPAPTSSQMYSGYRRDSVMPVFNTPKSLPRRKSVMPVLAEEYQTARRNSVNPNSTSIQGMPTPRNEVVLVRPPVYVCPRRSSVLFNSTLFAHTPGKRTSKISRDDTNNVEADTSEAYMATQNNGQEDGGMVADDDINVSIWQKTVTRGRRRSSSGSLYKARRGSVSRIPIDQSTTGKGEQTNDSVSAGSVSFFGRKSSTERRPSIPKLKGNYLTGNLTEFKTVFGPNAHEELTSKAMRYGPLYQISALGQKIVFLFDHKDIDSLKKAEGKCPKHMDFKHLRIYRQRNNLPLGVLLSSGEEWKRQRKMLSKAMNSTVVQQQYIPVIDQVARSVIDVIKGKLNNGQFSEIYMPETDVNNYAIEAFGRVLYGRDLHCLAGESETDLHKFVEIAKSNFEDAKALMTLPSCLMLLHPAWRRHNEKWNFLLETTIKQSLLSIHCDNKTPCVLSHLINSGEMTESEMLVNLTDLLHASIDTTSTVIHWCLYELSKHPHHVSHIVEDYKHYVGDADGVTLDQLQNMTFLKAVVKETLRLHPVGFLACRTISKQMSVRNYTVQPQANVAACMYVMGRNKQLVQDPESFRPDRWLKDDLNLDRFYRDVPFGFGSRMCIGKRIAELEIALFILHFCQCFEFRLSPTCHINHTVKLLLVPSRPLELYVKARKGQTTGETSNFERS